MTEAHDLIERGHARYRTSKRAARAGRWAVHAGVGAGSIHAGAKYLASGGESGAIATAKHIFELKTNIPTSYPRLRKAGGWALDHAGAVGRGVRSAKAAASAPLHALDRTAARGARRFAANSARKNLALGVVRAGERLRVPTWAPKAALYGAGIVAAGEIGKAIGGSMIREGFRKAQKR